MKKLFAVVMAALMLLSMTACGSGSAPAATTAPAPAETYVVGICQLVQHDALDAATQGFKDALTDQLGDRVTFQEQNASGEPANCTTIVNGFVSSKVDLIMANATPALQAAQASPSFRETATVQLSRRPRSMVSVKGATTAEAAAVSV